MNNWSWLNFDSTSIQLKKNSCLFAQGSQVKRMHFIVNGRIKLIRHPIDGEDVVLHVATAGEMIAEASLFVEVYHCSAIVDQLTMVRCIDRDLVLESILKDENITKDVMRLFAKQIRDLRGLHELRNIRSAQARILAYLETLQGTSSTITLNMSLKDMAYRLGLAHETLYREMRNLETKGKIKRLSTNKIKLQYD